MKIRKSNSSYLKSTGIMVVIFSALFLSGISCSNSTNKSEKNDKDLSGKVDDVKEKVNEVIVQQKNDMKESVDSVVTDFNERLSKLQMKYDESNQKFDQQTNEVINRLKVERDSLQVKMKEMQSKSESDWENFKAEMDHDLKQFKTSVEGFFKDNS